MSHGDIFVLNGFTFAGACPRKLDATVYGGYGFAQLFIHPFDIPYHIVIAETDHPQSERAEKPRSFRVVLCCFAMAVAVDLDYQLQSGAIKIYDITTNRFLPQEFIVGKLPHAQNFLPDPVFGGRWVVAVFPSKDGKVFVVGKMGGVE